MAYAKKIVLHCPRGYDPRLDAGDGGRAYDLLTSFHPDETIEEVVAFARYLDVGDAGPEVQIVEL